MIPAADYSEGPFPTVYFSMVGPGQESMVNMSLVYTYDKISFLFCLIQLWHPYDKKCKVLANEWAATFRPPDKLVA